MPLVVPSLDSRSYQQLLDEALARVRVHNPEWTNFNDSDPGVTLLQLFAFLTENLLYRANQIPERNRRKFLALQGIQLQAATSARGLVTFSNDRLPLATMTLNHDLEVRAGAVPYRTETALDVLPVESRVMYKRRLSDQPQAVLDYYQQLYASYAPGSDPVPLTLYETVPLAAPGSSATAAGVNLALDTVDGSLWIALLRRPAHKAATLDQVRQALAGKTVSLGVVPALTGDTRVLTPAGQQALRAEALLRVEIPSGDALPSDRQPRYRALDTTAAVNVLVEPGVLQITLPPADALVLWNNVAPLEAGAGDFAPPLDDSTLEERLVTWLRLRLDPAAGAAQASAAILWVDLNAAPVTQRTHVANERLPAGTGQPDQVATLAHTPVIDHSVRLTVSARGATELWSETDDLLSAGPEVPVRDPAAPPGAAAPPAADPKVYVLDAEGGQLQFGDGLHGARPPFDATLLADYDYGAGRAGNVGSGAITSSPVLPAGLGVSNSLPTWGGADAESVQEGERQIARYVQHRDRLVTAEDFKTISMRTPGVELGRVEVVPVFNPNPNLPPQAGNAPGAVTLMVIPEVDLEHPSAPRPSRWFLDTVSAYLDPRRLVTTELFVRGPIYQGIWVSVGIEVVAGASVAQVREDVKQALLAFLAPLPALSPSEREDSALLASLPPGSNAATGWPLQTAVVRLQLWAVASRVAGVSLVRSVLLAADQAGPLASVDQVTMAGLQLPQVLGLAVSPGDPIGLDDLRSQAQGGGGSVGVPGTGGTGGTTGGTGGTGGTGRVLPVPIVPEECR